MMGFAALNPSYPIHSEITRLEDKIGSEVTRLETKIDLGCAT